MFWCITDVKSDSSNLSLCRESNRVLFDQLFDVLWNLPDARMRWTLALYRKALKGRPSIPSQNSPSTALRCNTIPNLYCDLDINVQYNELLDWLSSSERVTSLMMAIEAVWTWSQYRYHHLYFGSDHVDLSALSARLTNIVYSIEAGPFYHQNSASIIITCIIITLT